MDGAVEQPRLTLVGALTACLLLAGGAGANETDATRAFLAAHLGMAAGDFKRLDAGAVVAHALDAADRREVAARGVVRIRVPADFYLERLSDIVSFKRHEAVLQIGTFGTPPRPRDLQDLTLERGDLDDLRSCGVGRCDLNLPADAIARFRKEVAWGSPKAAAEANAVMRGWLGRFVADYRARGDAAAMLYADEEPPIDAAAEFRALIASGSGILDQFPGLAHYAVEYPKGRAPGVRDLFYWSKEKPGPSPTVTVTHLMMWPVHAVTPGSPVRHAVLSRQIYGSRYFDASMGLTLLLPDPADPSNATYVVYVNRSRLDAFGGLFGGLIRRTVRGRVRSGMAESLARIKVALERAHARPRGEGARYPVIVQAASLQESVVWLGFASASAAETPPPWVAASGHWYAGLWPPRPVSPRWASSPAASGSTASRPKP